MREGWLITHRSFLDLFALQDRRRVLDFTGFQKHYYLKDTTAVLGVLVIWKAGAQIIPFCVCYGIPALHDLLRPRLHLGGLLGFASIFKEDVRLRLSFGGPVFLLL